MMLKYTEKPHCGTACVEFLMKLMYITVYYGVIDMRTVHNDE